MNITWKKAIKAIGSAATVMSAASLTAYCTTKYLMKIAMDRYPPNMPKGVDKLIAGMIPSQDFLDTMEKAATRLSQQENETVTIRAHDDTLLVGHWIPCDNPKRILIAMHGWRSTWYRDFGIIADFWRNNGCSVLYAEQRGQGASGGDYMGFGLTERFDCLDWIHWVNDRFGTKLPIYLCGVSMGATTVLMAAGLDLPENVHGIGADCGFTSPDAIWRHVSSDNLHIPFGVYRRLANEICQQKIHFTSSDCSTVEALKKTKVPVLFIHGTDDTFVPVEMTYENYKACAGPKKLLVVPGADHGMSYYVERANYEATMLDFWKEYDNISFAGIKEGE